MTNDVIGTSRALNYEEPLLEYVRQVWWRGFALWQTHPIEPNSRKEKYWLRLNPEPQVLRHFVRLSNPKFLD